MTNRNHPRVVPDVDCWHIPPACQGQIVEVAYGSDGESFYRRTTNRSDRSVTYAAADVADCGCDDECDHWSPWNREPSAYEWTAVAS